MKHLLIILLSIALLGLGKKKPEPEAEELFIDKLNRLVVASKEAKEIFKELNNSDLARKIYEHLTREENLILEGKDIPAYIGEMLAKSREVESLYIATFLLDYKIDEDEAVELAAFFDRIPLFGLIPGTHWDRLATESDMTLEDEFRFHDSSVVFPISGEYEELFLNKEQAEMLVKSPKKIRLHYIRARELLKLAIR